MNPPPAVASSRPRSGRSRRGGGRRGGGRRRLAAAFFLPLLVLLPVLLLRLLFPLLTLLLPFAALVVSAATATVARPQQWGRCAADSSISDTQLPLRKVPAIEAQGPQLQPERPVGKGSQPTLPAHLRVEGNTTAEVRNAHHEQEYLQNKDGLTGTLSRCWWR